MFVQRKKKTENVYNNRIVWHKSAKKTNGGKKRKSIINHKNKKKEDEKVCELLTKSLCANHLIPKNPEAMTHNEKDVSEQRDGEERTDESA